MAGFAIRPGEGVGERISLAPGDRAPNSSKFVNIDDVAFFAVESFLTPVLSSGAYDHYGITRVDAASWRAALGSMSVAIEELKSASVSEHKALDYIANAKWISNHAELLEALQRGGLGAARQLLAMLEQFQGLIFEWLESHPAVFIHGV